MPMRLFVYSFRGSGASAVHGLRVSASPPLHGPKKSTSWLRLPDASHEVLPGSTPTWTFVGPWQCSEFSQSSQPGWGSSAFRMLHLSGVTSGSGFGQDSEVPVITSYRCGFDQFKSFDPGVGSGSVCPVWRRVWPETGAPLDISDSSGICCYRARPLSRCKLRRQQYAGVPRIVSLLLLSSFGPTLCRFPAGCLASPECLVACQSNLYLLPVSLYYSLHDGVTSPSTHSASSPML